MRLQYDDHLALLVSASARRQARRRATSRNRKPRLGSGLTMVRTSQSTAFLTRREAMAIGKTACPGASGSAQFFVGWVSEAQPTGHKALPLVGLRCADP